MFVFDRYQDVDQPPQDERPVGFAADQGQHRRRPHHHRGKALGNIQKIGRKCMVDGVLDKAEDADRAGAVVHGFVLGARPRW